MPYQELSPAKNKDAIAECEYATASRNLQFTRFTSCIGVVAKTQEGGNIIGIHLVMVDVKRLQAEKYDSYLSCPSTLSAWA